MSNVTTIFADFQQHLENEQLLREVKLSLSCLNCWSNHVSFHIY